MSPTSKFKVLGVPITEESVCLNTLVCARVNVYSVHCTYYYVYAYVDYNIFVIRFLLTNPMRSPILPVRLSP